jgi:hypothetical protein
MDYLFELKKLEERSPCSGAGAFYRPLSPCSSE